MPRSIAPLLVLTLAFPALAQRGEARFDLPEDQPPPAEEARNVRFELRGGARYHSSADFDDTPGDVSVWRVFGAADFTFNLGERAELTLTPDAEFSFYDVGGATAIAAGVTDPIEDTYRQRYEARLTVQADERWRLMLGGNVTWSAEFDADTDDAFTGGGFVAASYAFSPRFALGMGVNAQSRLEDNAWVFPFPILEWGINEQWLLSIRGPGGQLSYTPHQQWTLFARGFWEPREFRLDDEGSAPDGVLRDNRIVLDAGVTFRPTHTIELTGTVGATVHNNYEILDATGSRLGKDDADPHLNLGVGVKFKF